MKANGHSFFNFSNHSFFKPTFRRQNIFCVCFSIGVLNTLSVNLLKRVLHFTTNDYFFKQKVVLCFCTVLNRFRCIVTGGSAE